MTAATKAPAKSRSAKDSQGPKAKRVMTDEHKAALAEGRKHGKIVADYLAAIGKTKKKRGRQVTVETLTARLETAKKEIDSASPIERLKLTQFITDTETQIANMRATAPVDIEKLEKDFCKVGKAYAESQGISRATFIKNGVDKRVLEAAGI